MSLEQFVRLKTGSAHPSLFPDNLDIKPSGQTSSLICQEQQIRSPLLSPYVHITFQHKVTLFAPASKPGILLSDCRLLKRCL